MCLWWFLELYSWFRFFFGCFVLGQKLLISVKKFPLTFRGNSCLWRPRGVTPPTGIFPWLAFLISSCVCFVWLFDRLIYLLIVWYIDMLIDWSKCVRPAEVPCIEPILVFKLVPRFSPAAEKIFKYSFKEAKHSFRTHKISLWNTKYSCEHSNTCHCTSSGFPKLYREHIARIAKLPLLKSEL